MVTLLLRTICALLFVISLNCFSQVGINTENPQGVLDVTSINNTGLILPRVTRVENVTDGQGNLPVNGTMVYDVYRKKTCLYTNDSWVCNGFDSGGNPISEKIVMITPPQTLSKTQFYNSKIGHNKKTKQN